MPETVIDSGLLRRLEQFELLARRRARSAHRGERRSRARGHSIEFADYRNYVSGDDLRYLDWNLYGRLDRLFLKLYEEERELPVTLLLDASESMSFGAPAKFDFARQLAAAIGYVALCGFDRVSVLPFPDAPPGPESAVRAALRTVRGKRSALGFFQNLNRITASGQVDLNEALRRSALKLSRTGVAVVLSDFLDPGGYEAGLASLVARGFQVSVIHILAPQELAPETFGDLRLIDAETGAEQEVTFGRHRLAVYRKTVNGFCLRLKEYCTRRGIRYFLAPSAMNLEDLLMRQLREAGIWR